MLVNNPKPQIWREGSSLYWHSVRIIAFVQHVREVHPTLYASGVLKAVRVWVSGAHPKSHLGFGYPEYSKSAAKQMDKFRRKYPHIEEEFDMLERTRERLGVR